jgi:L-amino acid N-acyltransferase YncA
VDYDFRLMTQPVSPHAKGETRPWVDVMMERDWDQAREIFAEGIATENATFETEPPPWESWDASHIKSPRLVVRDGPRVVGWAALTPVSTRRVYRGVAEASVYIRASHRGSGLGSDLLQRLIEASEQAGFWTLQAHIFPENEASLRLVRRFGFRDVGVRKRLGQMNGIWRDVLLLERRSESAGR